MQPIRHIIENAPAFIPIPEALQHCRIELIIWPLDNLKTNLVSPDYERIKVEAVDIPSRDIRNARN